LRTHSLLWLVITCLTFLLAPLIVTPASYRGIIDAELGEAVRWYDRNEVIKIANAGEGLYRVMMIDTSIDPAVRQWMIKDAPPSKEMAPGQQLPSHLTVWADRLLGYWEALLLNIYLFCLRIAHSWAWVGYLLPFLAAVIFDGVMTRNAKVESFRYTSPTIYNLSWHAIIFIFSCTVVYFAMPLPVSVFFYPSVIALAGILVRAVISNVQHSA